MILGHDVGRDELYWDADVFVAVHWCAQVKVFYVDAHVFGAWSGEDAVEEELDSCEVGGGCADFAFVDYSVASHGEADAFGFGFVGSEGGHDAKVSGDAIGWFVGVLDEEHRV